MPAITTQELRSRLKEGSIVLWPYRDNVEEGSIVGIYDDQVNLCWLDGYKSRNDTVDISELLMLHDKKGPEHSLSIFTGRGYLTEAGQRWKEAHPA